MYPNFHTTIDFFFTSASLWDLLNIVETVNFSLISIVWQPLTNRKLSGDRMIIETYVTAPYVNSELIAP